MLESTLEMKKRISSTKRLIGGLCFCFGLLIGAFSTWVLFPVFTGDHYEGCCMIKSDFPNANKILFLSESPHTCAAIISENEFREAVEGCSGLVAHRRDEEFHGGKQAVREGVRGLWALIETYETLPDCVKSLSEDAGQDCVFSFYLPGVHRVYGQYFYIELGDGRGLLVFRRST